MGSVKFIWGALSHIANCMFIARKASCHEHIRTAKLALHLHYSIIIKEKKI
jgi:hypothetical protein